MVARVLGGASVRQALKDSDYVFHGTVTQKNEVPTVLNFYPMYQIEFEITKTFKGRKKDKIQVYTEIGADACEYPFEMGKEYTVYLRQRKMYVANEIEKVFFTDRCTRTTEKKEELALLNRGRKILWFWKCSKKRPLIQRSFLKFIGCNL